MSAVRRPGTLAIAALVVAASAGLGVAAWSLTRDSAAPLPQISVYSRGETVRVGPFLYCNVLNLDDCAQAGEQGALQSDTHAGETPRSGQGFGRGRPDHSPVAALSR